MTTLVVPSGTVFSHLKVIQEAPRRSRGKRAMVCRCKCGKQLAVLLESLRSGNTKSCGCRGLIQPDLGQLKPGEIPLFGAKARGRVALVDVEDYDLVMQYRWHVTERKAPERYPEGPYAYTKVRLEDGRTRHLSMHGMITGIAGIDHVNRDGLDNQRHNLRPATAFQNASNERGRFRSSSQYKGVSWAKGKSRWHARIAVGPKSYGLGYHASEIAAAMAYDAAAREFQGEYAYQNFPGALADELLERVRVETAEAAARHSAARSAVAVAMWAQREPATFACAECGNDFTSTSLRGAKYCSIPCCSKAMHRRRRERREQRRAAS